MMTLLEDERRVTWLINNAVVFRVGSDPKPQKTIGYLDGKSAVVQTDAGRPDRVELLQLKGRMSRITFEKRKGLVCGLLDVAGQPPVARPEVRRGVMPHNSVDCPA
jgi:hypothetical protein